MSERYLNPRTKSSDDGYGTSFMLVREMGIREKGSTLCEIRHQGTSIYLDAVAKPKSEAQMKVKDAHIHENIGEIFHTNEITPEKDFRVNTDVTIEEVPECSSAELFLRSSGKITEEKLVNVLKEKSFLLHNGITEVINTEEQTIEFEVINIDPPERPTVKVTHNTQIEFIDQAKRDEIKSKNQELSNQSGSSEMDVDVDVTPTTPSKSFEEDVAGLDEIKEEAERIITLFDPEKKEIIKEKYGEQFIQTGNGLLLYGPPGCGKTLVSEAIANEIKEELSDRYGDVKFIKMKGSQLESRYPGESERRIEYVFNKAKEDAKDGFVVLFFDEIETLMPDRGDEQLKRHERQITNAFLQEMNDVSDDLLVMGATNFPNKIDPAADRRFPMKVFTPPPDEEVMKKVWSKNLPEDIDLDEEDYDDLAEESTKFTPAEIVDEVLGGELQRELVLSVANENPKELNKGFLMEKIQNKEPETVAKYIDSIGTQSLEGYSELQDYVKEQIKERLGELPDEEA